VFKGAPLPLGIPLLLYRFLITTVLFASFPFTAGGQQREVFIPTAAARNRLGCGERRHISTEIKVRLRKLRARLRAARLERCVKSGPAAARCWRAQLTKRLGFDLAYALALTSYS